MFHILIWGGLKLRLGGLSPPKPPRGDGTVTAPGTALPSYQRVIERQQKADIRHIEAAARAP